MTAFGLPSTFQAIFRQLGEGLAVTYGVEVIEVTMTIWSEPVWGMLVFHVLTKSANCLLAKV